MCPVNDDVVEEKRLSDARTSQVPSRKWGRTRQRLGLFPP